MSPLDPPSSGAPASGRSYDEVPYPTGAFAETHPFRLATIATLYGLSPPDPRSARVLELGCGSGGNLLPMAGSLPEASFVGVDLSRRAITEAEAGRAALELKNLLFLARDLRGLDDSLGRFDYIIAHGVYSWVPREVQEKLLWLCGHLLSDSGVAYVSYNAMPGSMSRRMVRDMLRFHVKRKTEPRAQVQQARALLTFLADSVPAQEALYRGQLLAERTRLDEVADAVLYHDDLSAQNEALYLHEFVTRALQYGLGYLGDAEICDMHGHRISRTALDTLADIEDRVVFEQYLDFITGRAFRRTLLCRADAGVAGGPLVEVVPRLLCLSYASPESSPIPDANAKATERFRGRDGVVAATADPLTRAALWCLIDQAPAALSFDALFEALCARVPLHVPGEDALAELLLALYTSGLVELTVDALPITLQPGERPTTSALCRAQAAAGPVVTSERHKNVALDDDQARRLVTLLDGTRDRGALGEQLGIAADPLERALQRLSRMGLLIA